MTRPARDEFVPRGDSESPSERETEIRRRSVRRARLRARARRRALSRGDGRRTCGTFERRGTTFRTRIARVGSDRGRVGSCKTKDGVVRRRLDASSFFFRAQRLIGTIEVASREVPTKFPLSLVTDLSRPSRDARGRRRRDGPAPGGVFVAGAARVAGRPAGPPDVVHEPAEGTATREIRGHGEPPHLGEGRTRLVPLAPVIASRRLVTARVSIPRLTLHTHHLPRAFRLRADLHRGHAEGGGGEG